MMEICEKILSAFSSRQMPRETIPSPERDWLDTDERDALWFRGRLWQDLTWADWVAHRCALFQFSAGAFGYYLPSVMILSVQSPGEWFIAADSLISMLATVAKTEKSFTPKDFYTLEDRELKAVRDWLEYLRGASGYESEMDYELIDSALKKVDEIRRLHGKDTGGAGKKGT